MLNPQDHVSELVDDYLHGVLDPNDERIVESHCADCDECQAALEAARERREVLYAVAPSEASEKLIAETIDRVEKVSARRSRWFNVVKWSLLVSTAASALIIGSVHGYYHYLRPTPFDLRVLGQNKWIAGSTVTMRVGMFQWDDSQPVKNAKGRLILRGDSREVTLASFTTDEHGYGSPRFKTPEWPDGRYELLVRADAGDNNASSELIRRRVQLRRSWKLLLSVDKPFYRPGQTIHLRALALRRPDLKPLAGEDVGFSIRDARGNQIFKSSGATSRFGLASADCQLSTILHEGDYRIECRVGDTRSERTVKVREYVLPKFRVDVKFDEPFYLPDQEVTGVVSASYFFGQPLRGAKGSLLARSASGLRRLHRHEFTTDAEGRATFQFKLPTSLIGSVRDNRDAKIELIAEVTDSAGQAEQRLVSRTVTNNPIHLEVIPESATLAAGSPNTIYVYASYADGRPAADVEIQASGQAALRTDALGVASFKLTPPGREVSLTVSARDSEDRRGRRRVKFVSGVTSGDFVIRTDKAVCGGGESLTVSALGGGVEPVFLDVLQDDQTVVSTMIEMKQGSGQLTLDLPAEVFGTLRLVAYRFGADGLPVRKSRIVFVRQPRELVVKAELDKSRYQPGRKAVVKFRVERASGEKGPAALSIAAVDEALFALSDRERPGMEQVFFLLEQKLLEPVFQVYDWHPGDGPPNRRFEQALFARTSAASFGRDAIRLASPARTKRLRVSSVRLDRNPFTLTGNSFPSKARAVRKQRTQGLRSVAYAWVGLAGFGVFVGLVGLALFYPRIFMVLMVFFAGGVAMCCVLSFFMLASRDGLKMMADSAMPTSMAPPDVAGAEGPNAGPSEGEPGAAAGIRVRQWFPETLVWRPELITDENGEAELEIDLADSITTWRMSSSAVSEQGELGSALTRVPVFQPFFVELNAPVELTRNDEIDLPIVVYNYLDQPQSVEISVRVEQWFERRDGGESLTVELQPNEVRSVSLPIRATKIGRFPLEVTARGGEVADAIRREITVASDGYRRERTVAASVSQPVELDIELPEDAIPGSQRGVIRVYPSAFSHVVEGMEAMFRMPRGCFEQTSSSTYPNVLALDYLRRTRQSLPEIEAKARQFIHVGYQRLLTFEVRGGGFDWYGSPPANVTLTAYGLMEFEDMANVHDVEPDLIARTRRWLLSKRNASGAWPPGGERQFRAVRRGEADLEFAATAYVAWAVFRNGQARGQARPTIDYLLAREPSTIEDPYLLALALNALLAVGQEGKQVDEYFERLLELRSTDLATGETWWSLGDGETLFHGGGGVANVEVTALVVLALRDAERQPEIGDAAIRWLLGRKSPQGGWRGTQATILALQALMRGTGGGGRKQEPLSLEILVDGQSARMIEIPADQSDVVRTVDISGLITPATRSISVVDRAESLAHVQVAVSYHHPEAPPAPKRERRLDVTVDYDAEELSVGADLPATAKVTNPSMIPAPMVIVDLPIPPGFVVDRASLLKLADRPEVDKFETTSRQIILYLRSIQPGQTLELPYRLRARLPVRVQASPPRTYLYYNPDRGGVGKPATIRVTET